MRRTTCNVKGLFVGALTTLALAASPLLAAEAVSEAAKPELKPSLPEAADPACA